GPLCAAGGRELGIRQGLGEYGGALARLELATLGPGKPGRCRAVVFARPHSPASPAGKASAGWPWRDSRVLWRAGDTVHRVGVAARQHRGAAVLGPHDPASA